MLNLLKLGKKKKKATAAKKGGRWSPVLFMAFVDHFPTMKNLTNEVKRVSDIYTKTKPPKLKSWAPKESTSSNMPQSDFTQEFPAMRMCEYLVGRDRKRDMAGFESEILDLERKRLRATEIHDAFKRALCRLHRTVRDAGGRMGPEDYDAYVKDMEFDIDRERFVLGMVKGWKDELGDWIEALVEIRDIWTEVWDVYQGRKFGKKSEVEVQQYLRELEKEHDDAVWYLNYAKLGAYEHGKFVMELAGLET